MNVKQLKPHLLYILRDKNVIDPRIEAARWGSGCTS